MAVPLIPDDLVPYLTEDEAREYERCLEVLAAQTDPFDVLGYEPCGVVTDALRAGLPSPPRCGACPQELFHAAQEFEVAYGGAAGGGKSAAVVVDAMVKCHQHPRLRAGIFRKTYDQLAESIFPNFERFQWGRPFGATWNANDHVLSFPNGSLIRCRYLARVADAENRQGGEYQIEYVDEYTLLAPEAVDHLKERLRTGDPRVPVFGFRCTFNPGGIGHGRAKQRYIEATNHGAEVYTDEAGLTVRFIQAKASDNRHLDANYRRVLDAIPDPARRAAMRDGNWDTFSGQFFGEWNRERHVFAQPFPIPDSWARYRGVDWGFAKPWAVEWVALDEDGRAWVYREMYAAGVGEHDQAKRIVQAETVMPAPTRTMPEPEPERESVHGVGDPAMWARRGDAESIATAYAREGCGLTPANNDRVGGWQRVHTFLAEGPACRYHREQGWETCPMLHVFANCTELIRTLPDLPFDGTRAEDVDTDAEDHAPDALRYALMAAGSVATFYVADDATVSDEELPQPHRSFGPFALPEGYRDPLDT